MASSRLLVYKPSSSSLEAIVNHVNPEILKKTEREARDAGLDAALKPLEIGTVRYTSSNRMQSLSNVKPVKVKIHPSDFLARRVAVLGMTRTGKSNTIKTIISAVANISTEKSPIGQLVFDINGEYANANHQDDGSSIAEAFQDRCERYRGLITEKDKGFRDLRINFYYQTGDALALLRDLAAAQRGFGQAQDVKNFLESELEEPDREDWGAHNRWELRKSIFQCILCQAGYVPPRDISVNFSISAEVFNALKLEDDIPRPEKGRLRLTLDQACSLFLSARLANLELKKRNGVGLKNTSGKAWIDADSEAFLNVLARKNSSGADIKGFREFSSFKNYHSPHRNEDIIEEIMGLLKKGKIVILDLSVGRASIRKTLAERIARQVFERGMNDMHNGRTPQNMALYIEEAHNLIGKEESLDNTWPRLAKEGAKARIALVYATQEPSSIHRNILANTENWFVCHLNNDDEIRALSKFYDFADFAASLKTAQDVGFARIKTLSSPFVVPVQIKKFSPLDAKSKT